MSKLGKDWDTFEKDGHFFARVSGEYGQYGKEEDSWKCSICGAKTDTHNFTGLPDDSWAKIRINGITYDQGRDFETCEEVSILVVMMS